MKDESKTLPAELDRDIHLRFLERMEQVNRVIQRADDVEQMMSDVLQVTLEIFDTDRVWLLYPCDPEAESWSVPMERTVPKYPGAFAIGQQFPMMPEAAAMCREALDADDVVTIDYGNPDTDQDTRERFLVQTAIQVAVRPPRGKPWMFGMHQCAYHRDWTQEDKNLFREIGHRLGDALSMLLLLRDLGTSEEKYRLLAENATDVIWTMDTNLQFTFVSPSIFQLTGYTAEETLVQPLSDALVPESQKVALSVFARQMQLIESGDDAGWEPVVFELEQHCKDGSTVFTGNNAKITNGSDGQPALIVGVTHDISDRIRAEEEKAKLEVQLLHAQKMEAVGRLAGGVAHDFNNMLCAIIGNTELALGVLSEGDPLYESTVEIAEAAERAAELTGHLLAFSRKQVITPRVISLSDLIESLHPMLVRLIGENIRFQTVAPKGLGRIRADPGQVEQIVVNLAINARDAMPEGGELLIETADVYLDDEYCDRHANTTAGAYIMLAVSDTGCGVSSEIREKIFEPFFTTKELGQGTGLGLAMVHGTVEQNNGRIEVYSEPGEGTSFKVYFPRVLDEAETLLPAHGLHSATGNETVLVVEDEELVRNSAVRLLTSCGYQVLSAASPGDALLLVQRHEGKIDLLLTDVVMPHMNGRELSDRIVEMRPEVKVLYTSGYTQNVIAHHGVLHEGVQFVAKPFSRASLSARVREVLDGRG